MDALPGWAVLATMSSSRAGTKRSTSKNRRKLLAKFVLVTKVTVHPCLQATTHQHPQSVRGTTSNNAEVRLSVALQKTIQFGTQL